MTIITSSLGRATAAVLMALCTLSAVGQTRRSYIGFDRNTYPGDAEIRQLSRKFAFTGYWLNNPPGATSNNWLGKRQAIRRAGLGFVVLWNGRTFQQLRTKAQELGREDAKAAVAAARGEGFRRGTVIFLDQEEGGRLLPEQKQYLYAWMDGVAAAGYKAGVYCSGIAYVEEGSGESVITAQDIHSHAGKRKIVYWVANDACPPSPGCVEDTKISTVDSGLKFVDIWQYAQSPVRDGLTASCRKTYDETTNCYVKGTKIDVDLDVATSKDPSRGR